MIEEKEYAATHSMSTAWYAVDDDGNVAMLYFEDNGPVPQLCPGENSIDEMIMCYLNENVDGVVNANFTDAQADVIIDRLEYVSKETEASYLEYQQVIRISPNKVDAFMRIMRKYHEFTEDSPLVCLNRNRNLYYIDGVPEDACRELIAEKVITRYGQADLSGICELESYKDNFGDWPYFIYYQGYNPEEPAVRAIIPRIPLKTDQISESAVKNAIHIKGNFNQIKNLQLCSLFPFETYFGACKKHNGFIAQDENGTEKVYSSNTFPESWIGTEKDPNVSKWKISQGSDEPTCLYLDSPLPSLEQSSRIYSDNGSGRRMWYVYNILHGSDFAKKGSYNTPTREAYDLNYSDVADTFPAVRHNLEEIVEFLQPWVIVAQTEILEILKDSFEIADGKITVNGIQYPFHTDNELKESGPDILKQYQDKPYRGTRCNRVRPLKNEGEA